MDRFLGTTLEGRYLLEELIGVGGMANVYKGFDRKEGRPVAVKILRDEYSSNDEFLRRFRDESRAIYSLNHPNIVKIYDVILNAQNPAIVMEYVSGITVKDYLERRGIVSIRVAINLTIQLLRALQHAHDNGIVHRDIKPQNVMVPGDGTVRVMDFGIARFAMSQSRTITNKAIGSVHYTSPEQARGDVTIDHRSDIYSTGIILYEMVTGALPFEGENPVAVAMKQINEQPVPPSFINKEIPRGLEEIILRAMAKLPEERYQSAKEMIRDLEAFSQDPAIIFGYRQTPPEAVKKLQNNSEVKQMSTKAQGTAKVKKKRKQVSFLSVLFGITCAFVVGTLGFIGYMLYHNNPFEKVPEVPMPSLLGMDYNQVIKNPEYKNFKFELVAQEYNPKYQQGQIYEQYPTSGKKVKEGTIVELKVSNGQQTVTLPNFADTEATLVLAKLTEMGLQGEQELVESESISEGNVVSTQPGSNETVSMGSSVKIFVSRGTGKERIAVHDVTGQDYETAKQLLESQGLKVGTVTKRVSELPLGTVIAQTPNYPGLVPVGGKVNLVIAADMSDAVESGKNVTILCMLPLDVDELVRLTVDQDGVQFLNQTMVPSESRVVNINVPGESGESTITVKINDKVYMAYTANFDEEKGKYTTTVDNSNGFKVK